jgi:hypothetical protein
MLISVSFLNWITVFVYVEIFIQINKVYLFSILVCFCVLEFYFNPSRWILKTTVVRPPAVVFLHCPFKFCTKLYYNS